jgi:hypothetical protein
LCTYRNYSHELHLRCCRHTTKNLKLYGAVLLFATGWRLLVGGWRQRIDKSGVELLNRPRHTQGCRVDRRRGRSHSRSGHEDPEEEWGYSSTLSLTSPLDRAGWSTLSPSRFTPEKETRHRLYRRLGGLQSRCGWVRKISPPRGFDPHTTQPVASRCIDWVIAALLLVNALTNVLYWRKRHWQIVDKLSSYQLFLAWWQVSFTL